MILEPSGESLNAVLSLLWVEPVADEWHLGKHEHDQVEDDDDDDRLDRGVLRLGDVGQREEVERAGEVEDHSGDQS